MDHHRLGQVEEETDLYHQTTTRTCSSTSQVLHLRSGPAARASLHNCPVGLQRYQHRLNNNKPIKRTILDI